MDLHPEEAVLSGAEDEEREHSDQDLQIRRTVTQVGLQLTILREWQIKYKEYKVLLLSKCCVLHVCFTDINGLNE